MTIAQASRTATLAWNGMRDMTVESWAGSVRFTPGGGGKIVWPTPSTAKITTMPIMAPTTTPRINRNIRARTPAPRPGRNLV